MHPHQRIKVLGLANAAQIGEGQIQFDRPIDEDFRLELLKIGLEGAAHRNQNCMGWIWRQWLLGTSPEVISNRVEQFVDRSLNLRSLSQGYHKLPAHDAYLLHCAIFASSEYQLKAVAGHVADNTGDKGDKPLNDGELYLASWTGMLKHSLLGNQEQALLQADNIWQARREHGVFTAPKPLTIAWLKQDWKKFVELQRVDFEKLWQRAKKDRWTVKAENDSEIVTTTDRYQIEHQWCWAHCGLALLAHRRGIEVATDPFWFPPHALKVVNRGSIER